MTQGTQAGAVWQPWGMGGEEAGRRGFRMRGTHIYLWPIQTDVWPKPSEHCNYPPIKISKWMKRKQTSDFLFSHCGSLAHWNAARAAPTAGRTLAFRGAFQSSLSDTSRVLKTKGLRVLDLWLLQPRHLRLLKTIPVWNILRLRSSVPTRERETAHLPGHPAFQGGRFSGTALHFSTWITDYKCNRLLTNKSEWSCPFTKNSERPVQWAVKADGLYSYLSNSKKFLRLPVHSNSLQGKLGKTY